MLSSKTCGTEPIKIAKRFRKNEEEDLEKHGGFT